MTIKMIQNSRKINSLGLVLLSFFIINSNNTFSLPIDWNGSLSFDSHLFYDFRKTTDQFDATNSGSTYIEDGSDSTGFQTYNFRLNPSILVNDSATIKAEFGMGNMRSDLIGVNAVNGGEGIKGTFNTHSANQEQLNVNQLYLLLYADTAIFKIGKFSKHFGLGAIFNEGNKLTDRYFSLYNGIELEFNLGNFSLTPMWSKISSNGKLDKDRDGDGENEAKYAPASGKNDVTEKGLTAIYKNSKTNFDAGFYYGTRLALGKNALYDGQETDLTITDIWFNKKIGKFEFGLEIPMISGKVKNYYAATDSDAALDSNAFILESKYFTESNWHFGLNAGSIKGDDGETDAFEAMYLHPNYKIGHILFAYNYAAFNDATKDIFAASVTNVEYAKLFTTYNGSTWKWTFSWLIAKAKEVGIEGDQAFSHETATLYTAAEDQSNDLGSELDIEFSYLWNPNITIDGYFAYLMTGKYYEFDNDADEKIKLKNPYSFGMNVGVKF